MAFDIFQYDFLGKMEIFNFSPRSCHEIDKENSSNPFALAKLAELHEIEIYGREHEQECSMSSSSHLHNAVEFISPFIFTQNL